MSNVPRMQMVAADAASHLDHMCALDIDSKANFVRLSGIICTIGKSARYPVLPYVLLQLFF